MPKIVNKDEKMKSISDAALKIFKSKGYYETRIADIAKAAGIGKGTIYEYFMDKEDILRFSMTQYFSIFTSGILETIKDKKQPSDKLFALLDFALRHADEWENHCAAYIDYFGSSRASYTEKFSIAIMYKEMKLLFSQLIREGQDSEELDKSYVPEIIAELFVSIYDGIILHRMFDTQIPDRESLRKTAVSLIQNGLLNRSDSNKS